MQPLQQLMFKQLADKALFEQSRQAAWRYADEIIERNVYPTREAIENLIRFDEPLPDDMGNPESILHLLDSCGSPATTAISGPRYFGFVNGGSLPVSLAARWLADFWDQNTALHVLSPVVSKLEAVVEGWLKELFGLPESTVAGFVSGSSVAIFCALAAARYRIYQNLGWDINRQGFHGAPKIRVVASRLAHGTVVKAIALLGLGIDNIEWLEVDNQGRVIEDSMPELDSSCIVILQAGDVNSGTFDPFEAIGQRVEAANGWLHIDGAFGLWAAASRRFAHLTEGIARAHSWSVDGHKTLNTPYDNGIVLCRDQHALRTALQASGSYIQYSNERDGMLYTPEMSRRARVVELWAALKFLGRQGVSQLVEQLHENTLLFARLIKEEGFCIHNEVEFNQLMISAESDAETERVMKLVQASGECWAGPARWRGRQVIRISICSWMTTADDIRRAVRAFAKAKQNV